jgi:ribosomal protein S18 acetylase RimI-like enzyme
MHEVERSFVAWGIPSVRLEVRVNNQTAQQLYEQIGYVVVQRMNKYYSNGDDGYMMIKVLDGVT